MKSAALFFACLPMLSIGLLLVSETGDDDANSADAPAASSHALKQQNNVRTSRAERRKVLPGYGDISGQILLDGGVPQPKILFKRNDPRVKDAAVCAAEDVMANDLLIDRKTKGIANAFVYIDTRNIKKHGIKVHPVAMQATEVPRVVKLKNCRFIPRAMVIRTGQRVVVKSTDTCSHNPHPGLIRNEEYGIIVSPRRGADGEIMRRTYDVAEPIPIPVKCDIHYWMKAHWLIIDHPYATVTDSQGRFTIRNLPVGEIEFRIWHERPGYIDKQYRVTVKEGRTALEPVKVPAETFE